MTDSRFSIDDFTEESKKIAENYKCIICNFVGVEFYSDKCGHPFCRDCIKPYFEKFGNCPISKTPLVFNDVHKLLNYDHIFNNLHINCPNKGFGCEWVDNTFRRENHILECKFEMIFCRNKECGMKIMRKDLTNHLSLCQFTIVSCNFCKMEFMRSQIKQHLGESCIFRELPCTQGCGLKIIACQMDEHVKKSCDLTIVNCDFREYNCDDLIIRKDMRKHFISDGYKHELNIIDYIMKFDSKIIENLNRISKAFEMYESEISLLEGKNEKKKKSKKGKAYKLD
jgi:hypothetical protein